ncbi:MAG: hypothetical protein OXC05_13055 [Halieaceae bacterium]|nr:hypothetical protein [Halieaceae bacterium]
MSEIQVNQRLRKITEEIVEAITPVLLNNNVAREELMMGAAWLAKLELPLFVGLNLLYFEGPVVDNQYKGQPGTEAFVQGPYYVADPVALQKPYRMPMRDDEPGTPLLFKARFVDVNGKAITGARMDLWQAGNDGTYSNFNANAPGGNLRAVMQADDAGEITVATVRPAPYEAVHEGPIYDFIHLIGYHAWRPAHLHLTLNAEGFQPLTTQLFFKGDRILEGIGDGVVGEIKDDLIMDVQSVENSEVASTYGLPARHEVAEFTFVMRAA